MGKILRALVGSLAIASIAAKGGCSWEGKKEDTALLLEPIKDANFSGEYQCGPKNLVKGSDDGSIMAPSKVFFCQMEGKAYVIDMYIDGKPHCEELDAYSFSTFSATKTEFPTKIEISGKMDDEKKLTVLRNSSSVFGGNEISHIFECIKVNSCDGKPEGKKSLRKGIFIRPCASKYALYSSFKSKKTNFGTDISEVCKDITSSGVTDVFLAFKVDDKKGETTICGEYGELLYNSGKYPSHRSKQFVEAYDKLNFDPIGALMNNSYCVSINFHAWFPVFHDPKAIQIAGGEKAGQKALQKTQEKGIVDSFLNSVESIFKKDESKTYVYTSKSFADPENIDVIQYEINLLDEILKLYPNLKGINLDYIRYADKSTEVGESLRPKDSDWDVKSEAVESFVKKIREKFPKVILSADVFASDGGRKSVGQDLILPHLDVLMPMDYSKFADFGGAENVAIWAAEARLKMLGGDVVPIIRSWLCKRSGRCSEDETLTTFKESMSNDITAVKIIGTKGYAIFTYESLLNDYGVKKLNLIVKSIGY